MADIYLPELNKIYHSDALSFMKSLPDNSIDMTMTSPPYWGLRDYGVAGQFGLEATLDEYIDKSIKFYSELKRILKDEGSFYLNLGDTYAGSNMGKGTQNKETSKQRYFPTTEHQIVHNRIRNIPAKCLVGIPWRVTLALIDNGWILRNSIIWQKPNAMPSAVKDRLNNTYEFVFHFVKSKKYYYNLDAIREPYKEATLKRMLYPINPYGGAGKVKMTGSQKGNLTNTKIKPNPKGKNPGDFWSISTRPFKEAHFATYPEDLCIKPVKSSCPVDGIVFDPFAGAGTTALATIKLGRNFLGCELNPEYIKIANARLEPYLETLFLEEAA